MSIQESLFHGVPILIIPMFGDQKANGERAIRQGYGRMLQLEGIYWNLNIIVAIVISLLRGGQSSVQFSSVCRVVGISGF